MPREAQKRVAAFLEEYDLHAPPAYRLLDASSELGELAAAVNAASGYGADPDGVAVPADEVGDALFALLAFADAVGVDAEVALGAALEKYERRLDERGSPASDG